MAELCQSTKSLRSSPLRGTPAERPAGDREDSDNGVARRTRATSYWRATDAQPHQDDLLASTLMRRAELTAPIRSDKNCLDETANQFA
jgi:hypothetical protein